MKQNVPVFLFTFAAAFACAITFNAEPTHAQEVFEVVRSKDVVRLRRLLDDRPGVITATNNEDQTPLHVAARLGQPEMVQLLLDRGADPNAASRFLDVQPLHSAGESGNVGVIQLLLDRKVAVDARNHAKETPLLLAAGAGSLHAVKLLLSHGAALKARDLLGRDALYHAASSDSIELVTFLLDSGLAIDAPDALGQTALHSAAQAARPEIVRLLLDRGADIKATSKSGASPVLLAVITEVERNDNFPTVRLLLERKAVPDLALGVTDYTPLGEAARFGKRAMAEALLGAGANINAATRHGGTPLHNAVYFNQREMVAFLLERGADARAVDHAGHTPLAAARSKAAEDERYDRRILQLLEQRGAPAVAPPPPNAQRLAHLKALQQATLRPASAPPLAARRPRQGRDQQALEPKALAVSVFAGLSAADGTVREDYHFADPKDAALLEEIVRLAAANQELRRSAVAKFGDKAAPHVPGGDPAKTRASLQAAAAAARVVQEGEAAVLIPRDAGSALDTTYFIRVDGRWKIDAARQFATDGAASKAEAMNIARRDAYSRLGAAIRIESGEVESAEEIPATIVGENFVWEATRDQRNAVSPNRAPTAPR